MTEYTIVIEKDEDGYLCWECPRPSGLSYPRKVN